MLLAIQKDSAKKYLDSYFNMMSVTGYIKHPLVERYLAFLFLVDFAERVYSLLTNEDYNKINAALMCIFGKGFCLLPYETMRQGLTIGDPVYMGTFNIRVTEEMKWRESENERFRLAEDED